METFSWNGTACTAKGIHLVDALTISVPKQRVEYIDVPGRSGSLTIYQGSQVYDDFTVALECYIDDLNSLTSVNSWLQGAGNLKLSKRTGGYWKGTVCEDMLFQRAMHAKQQHTFGVNIRCKPFFYIDSPQDITITQSGSTVNNTNNVFSEPLIEVTGTGDVQLTVGSTLVNLYGLTSTNPIKLDTELQEAFIGTLLANSSMGGEFPVLKPGTNGVSWIGSVTKVKISPRWREL